MNYKTIIEEAVNAASIASDQWLKDAVAEGPKYIVGNNPEWTLLDVCGNSWLRAADKRSKFAKWYKENVLSEYEERNWSGTIHLNYNHCYRQEYSLHRAAIEAAQAIFKKYDIKTKIYSYVD